MFRSRNWPLRLLGAGTLLLVAAADAAAQTESEPNRGWDPGCYGFNIDVGINLSTTDTGDPVAVSPDLWYTPVRRVRLVLGHSPQSAGGFYGTAGYPAEPHGLCVTGEANGCARIYDSFNAGADYWAVMGNFNAIFWARGVVRSVADHWVGATLGASLGKALSGGKLLLGINPNMYIGFTKRGGGNTELLTVPIHAMYVLSARIMIGIQTGIAAPPDAIRDGYRLPLGIGVMFTAKERMAIGAVFNLFAVTSGRSLPAGPDSRALSIMVSWTR